jgi:glycosyltransferase involved in cell wall biosynthesis
LKVTFVFRKLIPEFNSIEMLFAGVIAQLNSSVHISLIHVPTARVTLVGVLKNVFFVLKNRGGIVHITGHVNYLTLFGGCNTILTIHDIGSATVRKFPFSIIFSYFWFKIIILFAKLITVVSRFTRDEVIKLSPYSKNKIRVIPNPVNQDFIFNPQPFNEFLPKILIVGTKVNKNLERIFRSLSGICCELLILGKLNLNQIKLLNDYSIVYTNKFELSLNEVVILYRQADLLCFPSTYEGFGLPILEAQATGRPVVTSDLGAMKEVAGNSACMVDPYDENSIRIGIERVIHDFEYRENLIQKGLANVKNYKVEAIAQQYYSLYKEVESE